jgi:hypothetical protein
MFRYRLQPSAGVFFWESCACGIASPGKTTDEWPQGVETCERRNNFHRWAPAVTPHFTPARRGAAGLMPDYFLFTTLTA